MERRMWLKGATLIFALGLGDLAYGASVLTVRMWPAQDYTRITLESDGDLSYGHQLLDNPLRLEILLTDIQINSAIESLASKVQKTDPNVKGILVEQDKTATRIVVLLKEKIRPQIFKLVPAGPYKNRLVIDLYPSKPVDVLTSFIDQLRTEKKPLSSALFPKDTADPLGALIQKEIEKRKNPKSNQNTAKRSVKKPVTEPRLVIIALDPGHGGEDPGAIGPRGTREKDVVLRLGNMLSQRVNDASFQGNPLRTFFTRDADYFVPLNVRVQKAMKIQADLFMSLHADAFITNKPRGASVYALSQHGATSSAAKWLASSENNSDVVGGINTKESDVELLKTLLDMSTSAQIRDSLKLGNHLLGEIGQVGRLHKKHVEQAGFAVLKSPTIPSVLVESAFISNPDDEEKLNDPAFLSSIADALMLGINEYLKANPTLANKKESLIA